MTSVLILLSGVLVGILITLIGIQHFATPAHIVDETRDTIPLDYTQIGNDYIYRDSETGEVCVLSRGIHFREDPDGTTIEDKD